MSWSLHAAMRMFLFAIVDLVLAQSGDDLYSARASKSGYYALAVGLPKMYEINLFINIKI